MPVKKSHNESFKSLIDLLAHYEQETVTTYADSNANRLVVGDINDTELKDKAEQLTNEFKNPFETFYNWVRGECDDIESLYQAIRGRDALADIRQKVESKKKSDEVQLDKLN